MMNDDIEPIEPELWFRRVEMIAAGELGCIENSLRHAFHLLQLAPRPLRGQVGLSIDENSFETLLESGDFDTAARNLIARPAALSFEAGTPARPFRAKVKCWILNRTVEGSGDTVAHAVLVAWAICLLAISTEFGADLSGLPDQLQHNVDPNNRGHLRLTELSPMMPDGASPRPD